MPRARSFVVLSIPLFAFLAGSAPVLHAQTVAAARHVQPDAANAPETPLPPATAAAPPAADPAGSPGPAGPVPASVRETAPRHRALFSSLYVGLVTTQALDVHSTIRALDAGHKEANPLARWAAANPVTLVAYKTAATAGTLFLVERVRKKHPVRAVFLLAV